MNKGDAPSPSTRCRSTVWLSSPAEARRPRQESRGDGHVITAMMQDELQRIGHARAASRSSSPHARGLASLRKHGGGGGRPTSIPAAAWATRHPCSCSEKGIRLTGTDAWSWGRAILFHRTENGRGPRPSITGKCTRRPLHRLLHLESAQSRCAARRRSPSPAFPHKIRGASAGWTRAVAIFEE